MNRCRVHLSARCSPLPALAWSLIASLSAAPAQPRAAQDEPAGDASTEVSPADPKSGPHAASIEADQTEVKLGEPLWLTIRLRGAGADSVPYGLPESVDLSPFVELSRETRSEVESGQMVQVIRLRVACFEKLGQVQVPSMRLVPAANGSTGKTIELPAVPIEILSVIEGMEQPTPRDVAGPVDVFVSDHRPLVLMGLAGVWLLLGLVLRRATGPAEAIARRQLLPPPRLAHEIALEQLQRIVDDDLLRSEQFHSYFARISHTIREYLGNRYGFFALDLTTRELLEKLRGRLTPGLDLQQLKRLLEEADLVKFARLTPDDAMCSNAIDWAYESIETTRVPDETGRGASL